MALKWALYTSYGACSVLLPHFFVKIGDIHWNCHSLPERQKRIDPSAQIRARGRLTLNIFMRINVCRFKQSLTVEENQALSMSERRQKGNNKRWRWWLDGHTHSWMNMEYSFLISPFLDYVFWHHSLFCTGNKAEQDIDKIKTPNDHPIWKMMTKEGFR